MTCDAMKKMILSVVACAALMLGAFWAWASYRDILAASLFILALVPSCLFEEGRQERMSDRRKEGEL